MLLDEVPLVVELADNTDEEEEVPDTYKTRKLRATTVTMVLI